MLVKLDASILDPLSANRHSREFAAKAVNDNKVKANMRILDIDCKHNQIIK